MYIYIYIQERERERERARARKKERKPERERERERERAPWREPRNRNVWRWSETTETLNSKSQTLNPEPPKPQTYWKKPPEIVSEVHGLCPMRSSKKQHSTAACKSKQTLNPSTPDEMLVAPTTERMTVFMESYLKLGSAIGWTAEPSPSCWPAPTSESIWSPAE